MQTAKIIEIELIGYSDSIDITIDNIDHIFWANDIATSNSHSYAYALDSYYYSIYPKAHFPKAFYVAQLNNIKNLEEVRPIITEALELGVQILPPNATSKNTEFKIENGKIRFGLNHIKGSDSKSINKLANEITPNPTLSECLMLLTRLNKRATDGLIKAGAFSFLGISRSTLLHWLETLKKLNGEAQREFVLSFESIDVGLNELLCITPGRGKLLSTSVSLKAAERVRNYFDKPPTSLDDSIQQIFRWETEFLGYPFTSHEVDVYNALPTDFTCKDLKGLSYKQKGSISMRLIKVREWTNKNNETMAFIVGEDGSGVSSADLFAPKEVLQEYKALLYQDNIVLIHGEKRKEKFYIDSVRQL